MAVPKIAKSHDMLGKLLPKNRKKITFLFVTQTFRAIEMYLLTSVKPCINRIVHNTVTLSNDIAPIIRRFRNDDSAIDVPKIFVAGKIDAKKPAGICVIK